MPIDKALPADLERAVIIRKGRNTFATVTGQSKDFMTNMTDAFEQQVAKNTMARPSHLGCIYFKVQL